MNDQPDSPGPSQQMNMQAEPQERVMEDNNMPIELHAFMRNDLEADNASHMAVARSSNSLRRICIRGIRRLRHRGRGRQNRYFDSFVARGADRHAYGLGGVPSSPDGFSDDSIMEDDLSDGMSSISDFEERLPFAAEYGEASHPMSGIMVGVKGEKHTRGGKRTRTGSSSSNSSLDVGYCGSRQLPANVVQSNSQRVNLIDKLQKLRNDNEFTDVILVVDTTEIHCHRVVLAACSSYFHALLTSSMREVKEGKITIKGHKPQTLELLVRHAYAESIKVTADNAQDVLEAADYFQMDTLKDHCEGFLVRQVAESNCLGLVQFAALHSLERLYRKAKRYAMRNFVKVSQQDEFVRLPLLSVARYLADNSLVVQREEHVFEAAMRWLEFVEERKEHAAKVLRSVRLFFVGSRFLFEVVSKHHLLQDNPAVQEILSEACKYHALGRTEWRQSKLPHTRPRASSGISEVLVAVGGICNNRRLLYTECYNAHTREWTSLADISTQHASMHSYSVCAHKNDIYITGGHSNSGMTVDTVSVYLSNINQWNLLSSMHHPRERHGSASVDGAVYVAGGLMASPKNRKKPGVLNSVERYRSTFNRWEKVKSLPKRCYSPGVLSYQEKLYVIGGVSMADECNNSSKIILDCIQCYNPLTDSWSQLPLGRALARLSCDSYGDHFYMISNNETSVFRYDPATSTLESWRELSVANVEFAGLTAFNGKLVISGGQKGNTTLNQMYMIDLDSGDVEEETKMKRSRCMHGCVPIDKFG